MDLADEPGVVGEPAMEFRILGPIEVWNSTDQVSVPVAKQRALAILLLCPGWVSEREWLA